MKKFTTNRYYCLMVIFLSWGLTLSASAQFTSGKVESGGLYTAMVKDANNNVYVTRVKPLTSGATYEVEKFTNGTGSPTVIYSGLTHQVEEFPWGLAATSTGNVFIATDFTSPGGAIIKLTNSGGTYTASTYQTGSYFTALAVDANDNLYATQKDPNVVAYDVVEYPANSAPNTAGTVLYVGLKTAQGYTYPTGLAIAANGDVYVADAFSNTPTITDGGNVFKLTAASSYAISTLSSGNYAVSLAFDATGNLYSTENRGSGYSLIEYANASGAGVPVYTGLHTNGIYYPWGIAILSSTNIRVTDGDDGTSGGAILKLTPASPSVTTDAATALISSSATLNGLVNDNGNTTTVSFVYGTSPTLSGATTVPATTGHIINAGSGNTAVAVNINGLTQLTTYYYEVSANNIGGTVKGTILSFTTPPAATVTTNAASAVTLSSATLNGLVNDDGNNTTVSFVYGTSPTLAGATTVPATTGHIINAGAGNTAVAVNIKGLTASTTYYDEVSASNVGGTVTGAILSFLTPPSLSYSSPKSYGSGVNIAPLNPVSSAVPAAAYGSNVAIGSGFNIPFGVAADVSGNVYVADYGNGAIKEIPAGGGAPVTLLTGFTTGIGVAVDAAGNIYVADGSNTTVNEYPAGTTTPVALASGFSSPYGIAVDKKGNVYVGDYGGSAVYKIAAGSGTAVAIGAGFANPIGVAVDGIGNVYVADFGNGLLKEIQASDGSTITLGSGFTTPAGVAVDPAGNIFVADYGASAIYELPAGLSTPTALGSGYSSPTGVAVDGYGKLAVANYQSTANTANYVEATPVGGFYLSTFLPAGLIFNSNTGVITGTPTTVAPAANYRVTAYNAGGGTSATINIRVTANPLLSKLVVNTATLSPAFAFNTYSYTSSVANSVSSVTVTPTTSDAAATVTVNGTAVASGTPSGPIALNIGPNVITTVVTAQDGATTQTYTVTITRAPSAVASLSGITPSKGMLNPAFATGTYSYKDVVGAGVASMTVTPTATDPTATITVNGSTVASGNASQSLPLVAGSNTITIVVTAQDGVTQLTYTITVTEPASTNANLSSLVPGTGSISPAFSPTTTSYTETVSYAVSSLTVTPTTVIAASTVTVNGTAVASGSASGAIPLAVGSNIISTVVTAQDGVTTNTYTLTVTRLAPAQNAQLSALSTNEGELNPAFSSTTINYTQSVDGTVSAMTVTPTTTNAYATITVNGVAVTSGSASQNLPLAVGPNTISIVVTAQDGTTKKTYTITVTRIPSTNATLSGLTVSNGSLTPAFASGTTSYNVGVGANIPSMTITPTSADPNATITVNGTVVTSGSASQSLPLVAGPNTITVLVTAQDGSTKMTYTIVVTEAVSTNDNLAGLKPSTGSISPAFSPTTTSYTESVANAVSSMTVTPTTSVYTSTVKVNGVAVTSGTASQSIALAVGANTINTVVTAQNGATKTYTITVTRASGGTDSYDPGISVTKPTETPTLDDDVIVVHQGVSPNGDGINDFLVIDGIQAYPDNKLTIMNRNGQLVYEASGYDNTTKVFDGHSNKNGQMQLPGTYFYQLDYTVNGNTKHKTGFLVLKY